MNDDDDDTVQLNIDTNRPELFDDDEHDAAHFAPGTETPPPTRPFRRSPLSAFTIHRFGLAGFDEPTENEHRIAPPVNLDQFYGADDDDLSILTFSTNDGYSDGHAELDDDAIDAFISSDERDDDYEPGNDDDDEIDDEDDDDDDDDNDNDDGFIARGGEF